MKVKDWYDHLILKEYQISEEGLALYRIFFAFTTMLVIGYPDLTWMAQVSDFYYQPQPLNIAQYIFQGVPSYTILFLLSLSPLICLIAVILGFKTRWFALTFGLLIMSSMALKAGFGKIDHGIIFPLTAIIMAFSGWDRKFSISIRRRTEKIDGFPHFLLAFMIALAMFSAGYLKWTAGWLDGDNAGVLHHFISSSIVWESKALWAPLMNEVQSVVIWEALDVATIAFEVLFLVAILKKKWFQRYLIVALVFHTLIFLILNIKIVNIFVAYALFLPWNYIHKRLIRLKSNLHQTFQGLKGYLIWIAILLIVSGMGYFIHAIEQETIISMLNAVLSLFELEYRWWQAIIVYGSSYIILVWIWLSRQKAN